MGQRGPKPLPANVHMLRGNPSKKSAAELFDGVHPLVEIPSCPNHLLPDAKKEWRRITVVLEELRLISKLDRAALAVYCQAYARWRQAELKIEELNASDPKSLAGLTRITPTGHERPGIWLRISAQAVDQMHKFLCEFGMSPSARSRVTPSELTGWLPGMGPGATGAAGSGAPTGFGAL